MALMTDDHILKVVNRTLSETVQALIEELKQADARIAKLEAALAEIAACPYAWGEETHDMRQIARSALGEDA